MTKPTLKVLKTWRFDAEFRAGGSRLVTHEAALTVSEIISNQVGFYESPIESNKVKN